MISPEDSDFESQFAELYPKVLAFALRRTGDRQTAEDIAAETFAVAWRRRDEPIKSRLPWLYGVARQLIRNQIRSAGRRERLQERVAGEPATSVRDPSQLVPERDATLSAFAALDDSDREILMLVAWDGVDSRDGALILGCTRTAFDLRLFRARRRLAKELAAAGHSQGEGSHPQPATASEET